MLLILCIVATIASFVIMAVGFAWTLTRWGKAASYRAGREVGEQMILDRMKRESHGAMVAQKASFKGHAEAFKTEATFSFAELKNWVAEGNWEDALPPIMAVAGMMGFLFFGALWVLVGAESKLIGVILVGAAGYCVVRTAMSVYKS